MNAKTLTWYGVRREEIPAIVAGAGVTRARSTVHPTDLLDSDTSVCVGFGRSSLGSEDYIPPSMFIMRDNETSETLSWLRVFAKGCFPLSQSCRVISNYDWKIICSNREDSYPRSDKWSSVVLGEILAQGDSDLEIEDFSLARASSCYSAAVARAALLYDSFSATRTCVERLREISGNNRFAPKAVPIDSLVPIWALASSRVEDADGLLELADMVLHAVESIEANTAASAFNRSTIKLNPALFGDSIEERVLAFQRLAMEVTSSGISKARSAASSAALLAVAAFLVGRGTSHVFLLKRVTPLHTSALAWFGLVAALAGSKTWDAGWLKLAKGVERQLRQAFDLEGPPQADLCWSEFNWISKSFSGPQGLSDLAKLNARSLAIELLPGVACNFRFAKASRTVVDEVAKLDQLKYTLDLRQMLEQFSALSVKARALLDVRPSPPSLEVRQQPLDLASGKDIDKPKVKRSYKRSDQR